jgi:pyruvate/2-oxoglutarate dehydrogenase complex dihydrolipoamide dehydrogenase (E3) component
MKVDDLVIGGGPGGTPAAMALAGSGRRVLLVEKGAGLGGTCLFEGCIPSKILRESASRLQAVRRAQEFGLRVPAGEIGRRLGRHHEAQGRDPARAGRRRLAARAPDSDFERAVRQQGIALELGAQVAAIARDGDGVRVHYLDAAGARHEAQADIVLEATGRRPNVDGLGLARTAVRHDGHGVKVDSKLETDERGIYAVGDVIGHPMFAHWATAQAQALAGHLLGRQVRFPTPATNTAAIFSAPEVGIAGLTESEARAQVSGHAEGMLKLVYDKASGAVLGVHVLAEDAASLVGEGALAAGAGIPVEALAAAIHSHPTLSESIGTAARETLAAGRRAQGR